MIRRVRLRRFKRFEDVTFNLPGHIVLAGPNNTGKTTLLQAIAAWSLALNRWKEIDNYEQHGTAGGPRLYLSAPISRQAFSAVPLRQFDLLWQHRRYKVREPIEIEIETDGWSLAMELQPDSTEQIYVRPSSVADPETVRVASLKPVFVPSMTGLSIDEPVYQPAKIAALLAQGKPGDVLRNLLLDAHGQGETWQELNASIKRLFRYELLPPDGRAAHILAEYSGGPEGTRLDLASAGSGFQQAVMLFALLLARPSSILLLDEPDAHLHVILQDAIYGELRAVAARQRSQLVIATHSEVIINAADVREICVLLDQPRPLADTEERRILIESLGILSHDDIMRALQARGVLYLEGPSDLDILRAFARVLEHPAEALLVQDLFCKPIVAETRADAPGIRARDHYKALRLARDIPALELLDGDARPEVGPTAITGQGFQRVRWRRYEIESYLVHPEALARFVTSVVGEVAAPAHVAALRDYLQANLPPAVFERPLGDHQYLHDTKARVSILPPALNAAGLPNLPYTRYHEIAALMRPEEIHPEVREKLDAIAAAFGA